MRDVSAFVCRHHNLRDNGNDGKREHIMKEQIIDIIEKRGVDAI